MFQLHAQLEADTQLLGAFPLSLLLLSKDANYPWCILVPRREGLREIYQLNQLDRQQLLNESCLVVGRLSLPVYLPRALPSGSLSCHDFV